MLKVVKRLFFLNLSLIPWFYTFIYVCYVQTSRLSVTTGFGRHDMPPPASNPDLWQFDLETDMWVASKIGNLPSKFGHTRSFGSRIIRYVRDGRTDKSNAYCPFRYGREHNKLYLFTSHAYKVQMKRNSSSYCFDAFIHIARLLFQQVINRLQKKTRGQSNLTKSASRGAHSPVRGHPRGSKVVPLNSWGRVSY